MAIAFVCVSFISCKKDETDLPQEDPAPIDIPETKPAVQTAVSVNINANCGGVYKAIPERYDSSNKRYPLLVFLHGIGELGNGTTDLVRISNTPVAARIRNKTFPIKFTVKGQDFSFIVLSPQFKNWPGPADVEAVISYAKQTLRIDTTRVYVMGMSMGGGATWEYGAAYAAKVAAIVPICGASSPDLTRSKKIAAANLPVWAFHNTDDPTVTVANTNQYVENINAQKPGIPAIKTISATGGHDAWSKATNPAYKENNMNTYEWMLQYKR
jgi:predicted peptidase